MSVPEKKPKDNLREKTLKLLSTLVPFLKKLIASAAVVAIIGFFGTKNITLLNEVKSNFLKIIEISEELTESAISKNMQLPEDEIENKKSLLVKLHARFPTDLQIDLKACIESLMVRARFAQDEVYNDRAVAMKAFRDKAQRSKQAVNHWYNTGLLFHVLPENKKKLGC